jgi:hypothetical protein
VTWLAWATKWTRRAAPPLEHIFDFESTPPPREGVSGEYASLYKYLENRYAQTVVLTFSQIEALIGFALPERARREVDWWANVEAVARQPRYSDAWSLARRRAAPNLLAQNVVFERYA